MSVPFWFNRHVGLAIPTVYIPAYNQDGRHHSINVESIIGRDNIIMLENMNQEYIQQQLNEYNKQKILSHVESCKKQNIDRSQH